MIANDTPKVPEQFWEKMFFDHLQLFWPPLFDLHLDARELDFLFFGLIFVDFLIRKSAFFDFFRFWLRAGLQEPSEVDFGTQKRQKPSPFWSPNSRFFGLFCDNIFGMDLRWLLVAIWTILGSQMGDFWSFFGTIFRM
jgi:hypothetical protein